MRIFFSAVRVPVHCLLRHEADLHAEEIRIAVSRREDFGRVRNRVDCLTDIDILRQSVLFVIDDYPLSIHFLPCIQSVRCLKHGIIIRAHLINDIKLSGLDAGRAGCHIRDNVIIDGLCWLRLISVPSAAVPLGPVGLIVLITVQADIAAFLPLAELIRTGAHIGFDRTGLRVQIIQHGFGHDHRTLSLGGNQLVQECCRILKGDLHRIVIHLFKPGIPHHGLGISVVLHPAVHGSDHIVRFHFFAVVELYALPQFPGIFFRIRTYFIGFAEFLPYLKVCIHCHQCFIDAAVRNHACRRISHHHGVQRSRLDLVADMDFFFVPRCSRTAVCFFPVPGLFRCSRIRSCRSRLLLCLPSAAGQRRRRHHTCQQPCHHSFFHL